MSKSRLNTIIEYNDNFEINIIITFDDKLPNILKCHINDEGELIMNVENYPAEINFEINELGELVLFINNQQVNYYINDENGDLLYSG